ncbi:hypothetical protein B0H21DRAFT_692939 [Amylocystis lapponica]|nr:hypothetical protein B0H21DRAFT_692939 [Amylocystis lapponica]
MDQDIAVKRKKQEDMDKDTSPARITSSRFFCGAAASQPPRSRGRACEDGDGCAPAGPSRLAYPEAEKENVPCPEDDDIFMEGPSPVTQEDGYLSPSSSLRQWDSFELSSPARPGAARRDVEDDGFGADVLSSPPVARPKARRLTREASGGGSADAAGSGRVLVRGSPARPAREVQEPGGLGPDLRDVFEDWDWDDVTSDIECPSAARSATSSPGPVTPDDSLEQIEGDVVICAGEDAEEVVEDVMDAQAAAARNERVANGWWEQWARRGAGSSDQVCFHYRVPCEPRGRLIRWTIFETETCAAETQGDYDNPGRTTATPAVPTTACSAWLEGEGRAAGSTFSREEKSCVHARGTDGSQGWSSE